jgi:hypothetical protein
MGRRNAEAAIGPGLARGSACWPDRIASDIARYHAVRSSPRIRTSGETPWMKIPTGPACSSLRGEWPVTGLRPEVIRDVLGQL